MGKQNAGHFPAGLPMLSTFFTQKAMNNLLSADL
jgi:hypothetical protein